MHRRRLRLSCSDEEDEADDGPRPATGSPPPQLHQQTIPHSNGIPPSYPPPAIEISDDEAGDFIDVPEDLSPPSPPPPPRAPAAAVSSRPAAAFNCPVSEHLGRMGLVLRREWLCSCLNQLEGSIRGFPALDVATRAKLCFEQFLLSDMNSSGGGVLPANVEASHLVDLSGPFVLQVDEIVNISCPLRGRYQNASAGPKRCLKLSMTDGVQRVFGMEYRPIKDLEPLAPAGLKIAVCNVHIRRGILMLVPEAVEVLGGVVSELEAARERLVSEVNKPPRGRRTRSGVLPPLATRATRAAWTPENVDSVQSGDHAMEDASISNAGGTDANLAYPAIPTTNTRSSVGSTGNLTAQREVYGPSSNFISDFEEMHVDAVRDPTLNPPRDVEDMHVDSFPTVSGSTSTTPLPDHGSAVGEMDLEFETMNRETPAPDPVPLETPAPDPVPLETPAPDPVPLDQEVIKTTDAVEHPHILSRDRESPFTYLSILSIKWAAMREQASSVKGKVKCFLTGVKSFQYKQRTTYDLRVYVDDGSLISEILIDHSVVQSGIGYTPEEVTAALSSRDRKVVSAMKETLKQFQTFLANFEGIMLIELNGTCPAPVARQMTAGCASDDARLLLERLRSEL